MIEDARNSLSFQSFAVSEFIGMSRFVTCLAVSHERLADQRVVVDEMLRMELYW